MMRWRNRLIFPRRGDLLAVLLGIALLAGAGVLASTGIWRPFGNYGFGPDWQCVWYGRGEPLCVKDKEPATH